MTASRENPIGSAGSHIVSAAVPDEIELARAGEYDLLALLLARAPDPELLKALSTLPGDDTPLGRAHRDLAAAASRHDGTEIAREFFDLFVGLGRGEILPYASYYLTGFLHERPLARLRADLARLGIERGGAVSEPEDHISLVCDAMAGLVAGRFGVEAHEQTTFFERHLKPWAGSLFDELKGWPNAGFYRAVGAYGAVWIQIERDAFEMDA